MPVTRNYVFGARAPSLNRESVELQMRNAHRYRNKLVELEHLRRAASEAVVRRLSPDYAAAAVSVDAAEARVEAAYQAVKVASQKARCRLEPTAEMTRELATAKSEREAAYQAAKQLKAAAYKNLQQLQEPYWDAVLRQFEQEGEHTPEIRAARQAVQEVQALRGKSRTYKAANKELQRQLQELADIKVAAQAYRDSRGQGEQSKEFKKARTALRKLLRPRYIAQLEAVGLDGGQSQYESTQKQERATCGCFWGTYLAIEDAAAKFHVGAPPVFKRFSGDGTIAVQLQDGLSVAEALDGQDTRLQIHLSNEEELATTGKSRGRRALGLVRMRIGSHGRKPIWAEIPVTFHRMLPRNGSIRWAYLHRRRVATHDEWQLRLTVKHEAEDVGVGVPSEAGTVVALHLGWRMMPDGTLRVATMKDTTGRVWEHRISADRLRYESKPDSLQSIRDRKLGRRRPRLADWLKRNAGILPAWLTEAASNLWQWTSQRRFAGLCLHWRENRFPGDDLAYGLLERWLKKDKHLYEYEENQRLRFLRWRKDEYRVLIKGLRQNFSKIILAKINYAELRKRQGPDKEQVQTEHQRRLSSVASPGMLAGLAKEYFTADTVLVAARQITGACHYCQQIDKWDRKSLEHTCTKCHRRWDQDHNAVANQLARGLALLHKTSDATAEPGTVDETEDPDDDAVAAKSKPARKSRRNRRASQLAD